MFDYEPIKAEAGKLFAGIPNYPYMDGRDLYGEMGPYGFMDGGPTASLTRRDADIAVRAAIGANAAAVAEQALAGLLACAKSVVKLNERMHGGHWDKATHKSLELHGRTIGLIGLGAIGQRFAQLLTKGRLLA